MVQEGMRKAVRPTTPFDPQYPREQYIFKGGPGSGNHGHQGRPGERGGSAAGDGSISSKDMAAIQTQTFDLMQTAREKDGPITQTIHESVTASGGKLRGIEHRLKTKSDRIAQKMAEKMQQENLTPEQARGAIYDSLRYTAEFSADQYTDGVDNLLGSLKAQGIVPLSNKDKNYWPPPPGIYHGINYVMQDKSGFKFELQFHTAESFATKSKVHSLYETFRSSGTSKEQRRSLWNQMHREWAGVRVPPGVKRLGRPMAQEQA